MEVFFSNLFDVSGRNIIKHLSRRGAAVARVTTESGTTSQEPEPESGTSDDRVGNLRVGNQSPESGTSHLALSQEPEARVRNQPPGPESGTRRQSQEPMNP